MKLRGPKAGEQLLARERPREQVDGSFIDRYADGISISRRRRRKAKVLQRALARLFPTGTGLEIVDLGCADGAIPLLLLQSASGPAIAHITGITLLDYNDLPDKPAHAHPRFRRAIADLQLPLAMPDLPWGACDAVLATAFLHYCADPSVPLATAVRLLKPGGYLLVSLPAPWALRLFKTGIPHLLPRNNRIRHLFSYANWRKLITAQGFNPVSEAPLGISNRLLVYQKT